MPIRKVIVLRLFLFLAAIESLVALYFLALIPTDARNAVLFGFSGSRLLLIGAVVFFILLILSMLFFFASLVKWLDSFLLKDGNPVVLSIFPEILLVAGILFLCTPPTMVGDALYLRLLPLVGLIVLLSIQTLVGQFIWTQRAINRSVFEDNRRKLQTFSAVLSVFVVLWIFISWSGVGINREPSGWLSPGTPVLPQQLLLSVAVGWLFAVFKKDLDGLARWDIFVGVIVWIGAGLIWWCEPMVRLSYFSPEPTPPNFEYYPYSDAILYDSFSHSLLIGESRNIGLTHRPLYSIFLSLLHFIGGNGLETVLFMQVFVLAFTPAVVYFLVTRLGGRPAGIIAALVLIFREKNSIALSNIIEVSHVKLVMSDVPTMLTMVLFIYFFIKWFSEREDKQILGVLSGVFLGLSIFIRSQALLLIPVTLLGIFLIERFKWVLIFKKATIFLLGVLVVIIPWVWRNYQLSGKFAVEYTGFYTRFIASSYSTSLGDVDVIPGETDEQYDVRMRSQIARYILDHPLEVVRFYSSYFLHNEIASVVYLPMSFRFDSIYDYVKKVGFWNSPYLGDVPLVNWPALFLIVLVIAFGIGAVFQKFRWIGLMPFLFHLTYSFSVVPVKQSGWRFILPVDWVTVLYFCIGLTEIGFLLYSLFSDKNDVQVSDFVAENSPRSVSWKNAGRALAVFAFLGASIPLIEWSVPEKYPYVPDSVLIESRVPEEFVLENEERITAVELQNLLETEANSTVMYGRALYPSYYEKGEFWGESSANLLEASAYSRLQFKLIGSENAFVFIPLLDAPKYFPHAADVFVIGCSQDASVRALIVKVNDQVLSSSPWRGLSCSLLE